MVSIVDGALTAFESGAVFTVCFEDDVVDGNSAVVVTIAREFVSVGDHALDLVGGEGDAGRRCLRRCLMLGWRRGRLFGLYWRWR